MVPPTNYQNTDRLNSERVAMGFGSDQTLTLLPSTNRSTNRPRQQQEDIPLNNLNRPSIAVEYLTNTSRSVAVAEQSQHSHLTHQALNQNNT